MFFVLKETAGGKVEMSVNVRTDQDATQLELQEADWLMELVGRDPGVELLEGSRRLQ